MEIIMNRKDAVALDRKDSFAKKRKLFSLPKGMIYLDGNSLGVLPKAAGPRVRHAVEVEWRRDLITSWNKNGWWNLPRKVGDKIAKVIGAAPGSVIVADTISVNLFKVLSAAVAKRHERKIILSDSGNFPSDLYVAQGLTQFMNDGHRLKVVAPEHVMEAIKDEVGVVMITDVDYRSARRHDMKAITARAHQKGCLVIWDLAHSAGRSRSPWRWSAIVGSSRTGAGRTPAWSSAANLRPRSGPPGRSGADRPAPGRPRRAK